MKIILGIIFPRLLSCRITLLCRQYILRHKIRTTNGLTSHDIKSSWMPILRKSGSEIIWYLGFEIGFPVRKALGSPFGSTLGYSINMLLVFSLWNYFGIWEGYLVGVIIGPLVGLMIGTGEGSLVGLSLGITLGSPIESPNQGSSMTGTLLGVTLGLWFGYEAVSYLCFCCRLKYCHKAIFGGGGGVLASLPLEF